MLIKTPKWKNLSIMIIILFAAVMLLEIYPRTEVLVISSYNLIKQNNYAENLSDIEYDLKSLDAEYIRLKSEIGSIVTEYKENQKLSDLFAMLDEIASDSEVKINSITPGKISEKDNLWLQPIDIAVTGNYVNIYNFVRFMEYSDKVTIIKSIDINPDKDKLSRLEAKIKMEIYLNL
ncbi:MAG: type 4a pilus biogenesis protein PilO [Rhodothermaceae bacterium]